MAAEIHALLVDSGFYSEAAVQAVERKADGAATGITVLCGGEKPSHHKTVADLLPQPEPEPPVLEASAWEKMADRLKTAIGRKLYKFRKQTVEMEHHSGQAPRGGTPFPQAHGRAWCIHFPSLRWCERRWEISFPPTRAL